MIEGLLRRAIQGVARVIARRIESGSRQGAGAGGIIGAMTGIAIGMTCVRSDARTPLIVALGMFGAILGAMTGASVIGLASADPVVVPPADRKGFVPLRNSASKPIRLSNWNAALVPVAVFLIGLLGVIAGIYCWTRKASPADADLYAVVQIALFPCLIVCAIAVTSFARQILWIDFGDNIAVRQPLARRFYKLVDIHAWRLRHHGRDVDKPTSDVPGVFVVLFNDGLRFEVRVTPSEAMRINEDLMTRCPTGAIAVFPPRFRRGPRRPSSRSIRR